LRCELRCGRTGISDLAAHDVRPGLSVVTELLCGVELPLRLVNETT